MIHPGWSTQKLAFFAGLITASMRLVTVSQLVDELRGFEPNSDEFFLAFVKSCKPYVTEDRWQGCVETIERLFK
jgi:hypothetical protein